MGGGTRARHAYSIGLELGLPTGIIAAIGSSTSLQNGHMMQMLTVVAFLRSCRRVWRARRPLIS